MLIWLLSCLASLKNVCLFEILHLVCSFFPFLAPSLLAPSLHPLLDSKPESLEAHKIKTAFFTHPTLTEIGRRLVSHYFLLTDEELAMWEEDPESFGNDMSPDRHFEWNVWTWLVHWKLTCLTVLLSMKWAIKLSVQTWYTNLVMSQWKRVY